MKKICYVIISFLKKKNSNKNKILFYKLSQNTIDPILSDLFSKISKIIKLSPVYVTFKISQAYLTLPIPHNVPSLSLLLLRCCYEVVAQC